MAPEQADSGKIYGKKIDMWALGIIMYNLISFGEHPLIKDNENTKVEDKEFMSRLKDP